MLLFSKQINLKRALQRYVSKPNGLKSKLLHKPIYETLLFCYKILMCFTCFWWKWKTTNKQTSKCRKNQYATKFHVDYERKNCVCVCVFATSINHLVGRPKVETQKNNTLSLLKWISFGVVYTYVCICFHKFWVFFVHHKLMNLYDVKCEFTIIVIWRSSSVPFLFAVPTKLYMM